MTILISLAMIVVDASVLIDAFLGNRAVEAVVAGRDLHAPVSIDAEVLHGLRHAWFAGMVTSEGGNGVIVLLRDLMLVRHSVQPYLSRMWSLRHNVSAYDAGYVALAESLNVPLVTRDARLSRSSGHTARIEYIA